MTDIPAPTVETVAEAIGNHEGWQRANHFWECACGETFGTKLYLDRHVARAVVAAELQALEEQR